MGIVASNTAANSISCPCGPIIIGTNAVVTSHRCSLFDDEWQAQIDATFDQGDT
jgi:hypothetical protein